MRVVLRAYSLGIVLVAVLMLAVACGGGSSGSKSGDSGLETYNPIIGSALDSTATPVPEISSGDIPRDWPSLADITPAQWAMAGFGVVREIPAELMAGSDLSEEAAVAAWRGYISNASMVGGAALEGTNLWAVLCSNGNVVAPPVSNIDKTNLGDTWELELGSEGNQHIVVRTKRGLIDQVMLDARVEGEILVATDASEQRYHEVVFTEKPEWKTLCGG